eukprot:Pgem_evm1s4381
MTKNDIKQKWEEMGKEASELGSKLHAIIEFFYNNSRKVPSKVGMNWQPYRTEWRIFDEDLKIAGTIDMMFKCDDEYIMVDWKRTKSIKLPQKCFKSIPELNLKDCNFHKYSLQLNMYKYILKSKYNVNVSKMYLAVFHSNNTTFLEYEVDDLQDKIETMIKLKYYQE